MRINKYLEIPFPFPFPALGHLRTPFFLVFFFFVLFINNIIIINSTLYCNDFNTCCAL